MRPALLVSLACLVASCRCGSSTSETASAGDAATALAPSSSVVASPSAPVNALPQPIASVEKFVNPHGLPAYDGPTGSIEGTITVVGDPAPETPYADFKSCPDGAPVYEKTFRDGPARPDGSRPLADALVVITGYAGFFVPEHEEAKLVTIQHCSFSTRTIDLTFGQRLDVKNLDRAVYAPALENSPTPALMVTPPQGEAVHLYPSRPGYTELVERMGPSFMKADVYVLLQPLHTVSDTAGHYRIDGVPVGTLDVNVRLKAINRDVTKPVEVKAGVISHVDVQLEYRAPDGGTVSHGPTPPRTIVK